MARRAGRRPGQAEPLPVAEPEATPVVGRAAARRLARMLHGEHPELLAEWLAAAVARGLRVPAQSLPGLLDQARRMTSADPGLRRLAALAGGSRARWLAGLNPEWAFVTAQAPGGEDVWRLGEAGIAQRDEEWMAALIGQAFRGRLAETAAGIAALRQLARRADPALGAPGALPDPAPGSPPALYDAAEVLRFRYDMLKELDVDHAG